MSSKEELKEQADKVEEIGTQVISRLDRITQRLQSKNIGSILIDIPEYQEIFNDKDISELIDRISSAIKGYQEEDFDLDPVIGTRDELLLSALLVNLSIKAGTLQGMSTHGELNRKTVMAQNFVQAVSSAEEEDVKITNAEAEAISRSSSIDATFLAAQTELSSRVLMNFLFAARHFVEILDSALNRSSRQQMAGL